LGPQGRVQGYQNPNERFWQVSGGRFLIAAGRSEDLVAWTNRLKSAGIKYLLVESIYADDVVERLRSATGASGTTLKVLRGQAMAAIELTQSAGLVTDSQGRNLRFEASGSGVSVLPESDSIGTIALRFNHHPHFRAYGIDADGKRRRLGLGRTPDGFMQVDLPPGNWKRIDIRVRDRRLPAALILNLSAVAALVAFMLAPRCMALRNEGKVKRAG
jgi:hypothetical protein